MGKIKHRNNHLRETLGLTQEELAILFNIPISLIAMYETNQRDLPTTVSLGMTQMIMHLLDKRKKEFMHPILKGENAKIISLLEDELRKNESHLLKCQKKIEDMKVKYEKAMANFHLAEYFETKAMENDTTSVKNSEFLLILAKTKLDQNGPLAQKKFTLQLETLKWQRNHLQEELKKATSVTASE
jgi:transcriptional regulator with XRE-family HTH domain